MFRSEYVRKYASEAALAQLSGHYKIQNHRIDDDGESSDSTISDFSEDEVQGMEL